MCVIGLKNWASHRYFPSFKRNRLFSVVVATNFLDLFSVLNAKFITNNFRFDLLFIRVFTEWVMCGTAKYIIQ